MSHTTTDNKFTNRVFGIAMVKSIISNYNADFTKQPRSLPSGTIYATDKALKYTIKHLIKKYYETVVTDDKGEEIVAREHTRVMYFRNYDGDMKPRTLGETYKFFFGEPPKRVKENSSEEFFLFYTDGSKVFGLIPSKPNTKDMNKEFWASLKDKEEEKWQFKKEIDKLFEKKNKPKKIAEVKEIEEVQKIIEDFDTDKNDLYFAFDTENNFRTLNIDSENFEAFKSLVLQIDNMATGGIDKYAVLKNLLKCIDVRLFGATFADQTNISIHGPVQITHGVDRLGKNSELRFSEQIMSPFRNSNEKSIDNDATTLGTQFQLEEGHYVHQFSINPGNLNTHNQNLPENEKVFLDSADIQILKEGLKKGVTDYDSASKKGSENELFLWIELKPDSRLVLPNMQFLVDIQPEKKEGKSVINMTKVFELLENLPMKKNDSNNEETQINKIELGFNHEVTEIEGLPKDNKVQDVSIEITVKASLS